MASRETPRLLINLERVGGIGSRPNDVVHIGECDAAVRKLCEELGGDWVTELEKLWEGTANSADASKGKGKAKEEPSLVPLAGPIVANQEEDDTDDQEAEYTKISAEVDAISQAIQDRMKLIDEFTEQALADIALDQDDDEDAEGEWEDYGLESDQEFELGPGEEDDGWPNTSAAAGGGGGTPATGSISSPVDPVKDSSTSKAAVKPGEAKPSQPAVESVIEPPQTEKLNKAETVTTSATTKPAGIISDKDKVNA